MFLSSVRGSLLWEHNAVNFAQVLGCYTRWYRAIYLDLRRYLVLGSIHLNKVLVCPTPSNTVAEPLMSKSTPARDIILFSPLFVLILTPCNIRIPLSPQSVHRDY